MSALNVFAGRTRADIWTDAAHLTPDGVVRKISSKAFVLGGLPAILTVSGPSDLGILAHLALFDRFDTVDALMDGAVGALQEHTPLCDPARGVVIVLSGYSIPHGLVRTAAMHTSGGIPGLDAWQFGEPTRWLMPNPPALMPDLATRGLDVLKADPIDDDDALMIMRAQRELRFDFPEAPGVQAVGGFAQCTSVTSDGVSTRVVERWPDVIGERIAA